MIAGIPYIAENNTPRKREILSRKTDDIRNVSLYDLFNNIQSKENLVVIENKWLTWLEDTNFDYLNKKAYIKYYTYSKYKTDKQLKLTYISDNDKHLDYDEDGTVYIRYGYKLNKLEINIGTTLHIYSLKEDKLIEYRIASFIGENFKFSLEELYNRYKTACYRDMQSEFGHHNGGYTFIYKELPQFKNKDAMLRRKYRLSTWEDGKSSAEHIRKDDIDNRDIRVYEYTKYISKVSEADTVSLSDERTYKYRRLLFDLYLYCSARAEIEPIDGNKYNWKELGKSIHYIKIKEGELPFFIKCEWFNTNTLKSTVTWRKTKTKELKET